MASGTKLAVEELWPVAAPDRCSRWGNRLARPNTDKAIKRLAALAAITKSLSPHSLRHSMMTAAVSTAACA